MRPITESMRRLVAAEKRAQAQRKVVRSKRKRKRKPAKRKKISYCKLLDRLQRKRMLRSVFDAECH